MWSTGGERMNTKSTPSHLSLQHHLSSYKSGTYVALSYCRAAQRIDATATPFRQRVVAPCSQTRAVSVPLAFRTPHAADERASSVSLGKFRRTKESNSLKGV